MTKTEFIQRYVIARAGIVNEDTTFENDVDAAEIAASVVEGAGYKFDEVDNLIEIDNSLIGIRYELEQLNQKCSISDEIHALTEAVDYNVKQVAHQIERK